MWFGSGGPAPGPLAGAHQVCRTSVSPLRVDCLLLRTPVTFADLDSSVQPVSAPAWTALLFSAFTEKVETRGLGRRQRQASASPRPSRYSGVTRPRK